MKGTAKGPPQLIKSVRFGFLMKKGGVGFETLKKLNFIITITVLDNESGRSTLKCQNTPLIEA